jgi:beta-galactosidase GanA
MAISNSLWLKPFKRIVIICFTASLLILPISPGPVSAGSDADIPHLRKQGTATQLMVDGEPLLILGGELGNSTASSLAYMRPIWPKLVGMHLNTVLAPVYWELLEPQEGEFDFSLVDSLIVEARGNDLHLVFLWFASWKNSMSSYAPLWVKTYQKRFPRAQDKDGHGMEILSCFSQQNRDADARAFKALMQHLRQVDGEAHTVVMIQVENEIGMIPDSRDRSPEADGLFSGEAAPELMDYLQKNKDSLIPEFRKVWEAAGFKTSGTWEEVFGQGPGTDEIFMAWHYARYVNHIVEAGKAEYPLPMFVNAALIRPNYQPGQYPSAGPLPHIMDVWHAGAPDVDFLAPDIYFPNFAEWCQKYHRSGNPLFIPEAIRGPVSTANVFYAFGQHDAMGFCLFSIESTDDPLSEPLTGAYEVLTQLTPLILEKQGKGVMAGVLLDKELQKQQITLGGYVLNAAHDYTWAWSRHAGSEEEWPRFGALIVMLGPDEFLMAGRGVIFTFEPKPPSEERVGIGFVDEGRYVNGRWVRGRRMNGDQSHQGRHVRLEPDEFSIQHVRLYRYR